MPLSNKQSNLIPRLGFLLLALLSGWVPIVYVKELLSEPLHINFRTIIDWLIVFVFIGGFSFYFLINSLFFNKINHKWWVKEQKRKQQYLNQLAYSIDNGTCKPVDTTTILLLENVSDFEALKQCIYDRVEITETEKIDNLPFLWRYGGCYVVTFPYSVSRQYLCELADDIWVFCSCTVQAWCKPELFKKHTGNWLYLCFGQEDLLVAVAEDNSQWDINPDDAMLHKTNRYDRSFRSYPTLNHSLMERIQY